MAWFGSIRVIAAIAVCLAWGLAFAPAPARAECLDAPDLASYRTATAADYALGPTRSDRLGRVVAPVNVNGQGPFRFIVDTGANRSAVSQVLAERLGLAAAGTGSVHTIYGVSDAPFVNVTSLQYANLPMGGASMPMLQNEVLAGEHGLLGVDGMRGRRLRMDFERNCIEIIASRGAPPLSGWTTIRGELRFRHLVLLHGFVNRLPVAMFVDTGSNSTLANFALRDRLRARSGVRTRNVDPVRAYTAGLPVVLDTIIALPRINLGEIEARDITAYVGDFHIFQLWNLTEEPALLIGMDVLSQTRGLAIDYGRASVHFRLRDTVRTGSRLSGGSRAGVTVRN